MLKGTKWHLSVVGSFQVESIATSVRLNKAVSNPGNVWSIWYQAVMYQKLGKKEKDGPVGVTSNEWTQPDFKEGQ